VPQALLLALALRPLLRDTLVELLLVDNALPLLLRQKCLRVGALLRDGASDDVLYLVMGGLRDDRRLLGKLRLHGHVRDVPQDLALNSHQAVHDGAVASLTQLALVSDGGANAVVFP